MKWEKQRFGDVIEFNPRVSLEKGVEYPYLPMEEIQPGRKFNSPSNTRVYTSGGARFANNDTVLARITPCLENGKVSKIAHLEGGLGFGSTEYFVFRAIEGKTDPDYIYYLAASDIVRQPAIKSMVGASGRQRADRGVVENLTIPFPDLDTQKYIAEILSAYDDLIVNNNRRIALLEEAIHRLYREWFVHLRFPGHEQTPVVAGVPEGWEKRPMGEVCDLTMGQSPKSEFYNTYGEGLPFHQGVKDFGTRFVTHNTWCTQPNRIAEPGDILFSVRAPVGRINVASDKLIIGRGLAAIRNKRNFQSFQLYQLKTQFFKEDMIGGGAIFASVTKKQLSQQLLLVPSDKILEDFECIAAPVDQQIANLSTQNIKLAEARDALLPRLMNGSLPV